MFGPPENPELAQIVTISSPQAARRSTRKLQQKYNAADRDRRIEIIRAANLAANRASAQLNRRNLSEKEQRQMRKVAQIYRRFVDQNQQHTRILGMSGSGDGAGPAVNIGLFNTR